MKVFLSQLQMKTQKNARANRAPRVEQACGHDNLAAGGGQVHDVKTRTSLVVIWSFSDE